MSLSIFNVPMHRFIEASVCVCASVCTSLVVRKFVHASLCQCVCLLVHEFVPIGVPVHRLVGCAFVCVRPSVPKFASILVPWCMSLFMLVRRCVGLSECDFVCVWHNVYDFKIS